MNLVSPRGAAANRANNGLAFLPLEDEMETKHTPGPWSIKVVLDEVDQLERQVIAVPIPHSIGKHIAQICTWGGNHDPEANANAHLISAAPGLLEALRLAETTIERLNRHNSADGTLDVVRAAIAKAEKAP